jgi:hypothetical protein
MHFIFFSEKGHTKIGRVNEENILGRTERNDSVILRDVGRKMV